jgi:DNA-binding NarL/FixJ family response regulator
MTDPLNILIIDDHPVVLFGLRLLFSDYPGATIRAEAQDVATARLLTETHKPDFIILDLMLGGRDGIELIGDLLKIHPAAKIIVYSSQDERLFARRVLQAGAHGYVAKSESLAVVATAVEVVAAGDLFFSPAVQQMLLRDLSRAGPLSASPYEALSNREMQVLRMIGAGLSTQDIAAELNLSVKTIGTYRERIKIKLGLDRAKALEEVAAAFARPDHDP